MNNKIILLLGILGVLSCNVFATKEETDTALKAYVAEIDDWLEVANLQFAEPIKVALDATNKALDLASDPSNNEALVGELETIKTLIYKHKNEKDGLKERLARARTSKQ